MQRHVLWVMLYTRTVLVEINKLSNSERILKITRFYAIIITIGWHVLRHSVDCLRSGYMKNTCGVSLRAPLTGQQKEVFLVELTRAVTVPLIPFPFQFWSVFQQKPRFSVWFGF